VQLIKSYRVFCGAEAPANHDHHLTTAELEIHPQFSRRKSRSRRFDIEKLRTDSSAAENYTVALHNRFDVLADLPEDIESAWSTVRDQFQLAAEETIGHSKPRRRPWLSAETCSVLEDKGKQQRRTRDCKAFSGPKPRQTAKHTSTA